MSYWYPRACAVLSILFEDFVPGSSAIGQKTYVLPVQCKNVSVSVNDYKTSDTFNMEIEYKNFPFDPRVIRSCAVSIYMQDVKSNYNTDGSLNKIKPTVNNVVFQGFADEESITFNDSNRTIRLEGRDLTSLLLDQKYEGGSPIPLNIPLDVAIQTFLKQFPATQKINVVNRNLVNGVKQPIPSVDQYASLADPLAGMHSPGRHESYWEIIQFYATQVGLICYMSLNDIILTTPRALFSPDKAILFVEGINIKNLEIKHKLGRLKGFNIEVRSLSEKHKKPLVARLPIQGTALWCTALGLPYQQDVYIPQLDSTGALSSSTFTLAPTLGFIVPNITDQDRLIQIGQNIYEDLSRQQLDAQFETSDMTAHSGKSSTDPNYQIFDLTQLQIGQPIGIEVDPNDLATITRLASDAARTQYLVSRGYDRNVASVLATALGKVAPVFYTKAFTLTMSQDSGFSLKLSLINFLDVKNRGLAS